MPCQFLYTPGDLSIALGVRRTWGSTPPRPHLAPSTHCEQEMFKRDVKSQPREGKTLACLGGKAGLCHFG